MRGTTFDLERHAILHRVNSDQFDELTARVAEARAVRTRAIRQVCLLVAERCGLRIDPADRRQLARLKPDLSRIAKADMANEIHGAAKAALAASGLDKPRVEILEARERQAYRLRETAGNRLLLHASRPINVYERAARRAEFDWDDFTTAGMAEELRYSKKALDTDRLAAQKQMNDPQLSEDEREFAAATVVDISAAQGIVDLLIEVADARPGDRTEKLEAARSKYIQVKEDIGVRYDRRRSAIELRPLRTERTASHEAHNADYACRIERAWIAVLTETDPATETVAAARDCFGAIDPVDQTGLDRLFDLALEHADPVPVVETKTRVVYRNTDDSWGRFPGAWP